MPDPNTEGEGALGNFDASDDEQFDQLESSELRPLPAASTSTDRPLINSLSFSTESVVVPYGPDSEEEEEQVGGGHKWLVAAAPTTPVKSRLRANIKPTPRASPSSKTSMVQRAEAAKTVPPPPPPDAMGPPALPKPLMICIGGQAMRTSPPPPGFSMQGPVQGSSVLLPPTQGSSVPQPPSRVPQPEKAPTFGAPRRVFAPQPSALARPPPPPPPQNVVPAPSLPSALPVSSPLPSSPAASQTAASESPPPGSMSEEPEQQRTPEPDLQVLSTPVVSPSAITIMNYKGVFETFLEEGAFMPLELPPSPLSSFNNGSAKLPLLYSEETRVERAGQKRKCTSLPGGELTAAQEAALGACCAKMLEVAVACATETNISQEHVLRRFASSISNVHSRRPHRWNLYQSYAQHEFNRTTELRHTVEGCEMSPDTEVAPLMKAQLSEAYTQFAEEILAKHSELVAAEEGPTVEGHQRRFGSLMHRWGSTPPVGEYRGARQFPGAVHDAGPHVHQDSEYAEFFEKLKYTQDEVLAAAKSAVYDWELTKLHELKGRGDVDDTSDAPDASTSNTSNTSNAVTSGSQQALTKIEHASAKVPLVKHDYSAMMAEEAKRAKRQLADTWTRAAKQLNLLIQGRIKRMSYFAANNLRMLGYPQGEARLPMEEYPSKGASGWWVIEHDGLTEALDARGTRNEGLRMESHQYKNGDIVIFSFDYSAPVPSINSPGYVKHWRTSHRKAVPAPMARGTLRLPAGGKKLKEAGLLATEAGRSKGKGKAKSKTPETPDPESEEDAPSPPKKQRTKPPVKKCAPTVASASSAHITTAGRTRATPGGTSRGDATLTSRSAAASSGSRKHSTSAAPDPSSNSAAEAPQRGARKIDGHPVSTSAVPASASEPAADELRRRTRSRTQEQQGGGPVKKVKFDPTTYVDSDSAGATSFCPTRTATMTRFCSPIGEAYLRPDGSYIGQMMEHPAPAPPASQKHGKTFAGVVIPTKPKEAHLHPRPVGKKHGAAVASTSGTVSPLPPPLHPASADAPPDAPAGPVSLPANAPQTAAALALPTDAKAILGNLMVMLAKFPPELLSGALAGAQAMQQHQPPQ
ncbi:hypothetical protein B0H14DRAFT_2603987 [Mycena olivaceomarginata]|nr:hypothetical protein B0H14DRAFT_2603987 [Mycena olivaceomarginata]